MPCWALCLERSSARLPLPDSSKSQLRRQLFQEAFPARPPTTQTSFPSVLLPQCTWPVSFRARTQPIRKYLCVFFPTKMSAREGRNGVFRCLSAWLVVAFNKCWNALTRLAKIKMTDNPRCWGGCGTVGTLRTAGKRGPRYNSSGEQFFSFLQSHIHLLYDPAMPLAGFCPRELKTYVHIKT